MNVQRAKKIFGLVQKPILVIVVDTTEMPGIPRHEFVLDAPEQWLSSIQSEMNACRASSAQTVQPTYVREVVKEIVKYPCPYCNTLMEITLNRCPSCGAPHKK